MPPVPDTLTHIGYYAVMLGGESAYNISNLVFGWPTNIGAAINTSSGPGLKFMYVASGWFLGQGGSLRADYKEVWEALFNKRPQ